MLPSLFERGGDVGIFEMANEIGEEVVFEVALLARARVDVGEVDVEAADDAEGVAYQSGTS